MSPKNPLLATGLTVLGLLGAAPPGVAEPAAAPSSPPSSASVAPSPTFAVLLLTNGKVVQGLVSEDETRYVVLTKLGKSPYPKNQVEKACRSIDDAYQYKVSRLPDRDPDEHLKLARWCLSNRLTLGAKTQLQAVLVLSPRHQEARNMLQKLDDAEIRRAFRDPNVMQTRAEVADDRPEPINPAVLGRAARELGIAGLPQIPGLPSALAVKRADEFRRTAHLVLQKHCARCHNERYPGNFRLVQFHSRRDATADAFRANLDAVLRLIDLQSPDKSELLSSTLRAHGSGTNKRPIFTGANDLSYQILAAWVNSLRPPRSPDDAQQARFVGSGVAAAEGDGFAIQRGGQVPLPLTPTPFGGARPLPPSAENPTTPLPPGQFLPGTGTAMQPYAPPNTEFPAPYLLGGPKPRLDAANPAAPPAGAAATAGTLPPLPGGSSGIPPEVADDAKPKAPRKPVKIDPELLQRALMNRFAPQ